MAKFSGANWRPLPENSTQSKIKPTQLIFHTAVDAPGPTDLYKYFGRADVDVESHFFVHFDGTCDQYIDTEVKADANYKANIRAISVETEDDGNTELPWTPAQLDTLRQIALWANATHGIPLVACPAWDQPGIGYHCMWGFKDNRNLIGVIDNPWTPNRGKICPGLVRIAQFWDELLPSLNNNAILVSKTTTTGATDMTPAQTDAVKALQGMLNTWGANIAVDGDPGPQTVDGLKRVLDYANWQIGVYKDKVEKAKGILNS